MRSLKLRDVLAYLNQGNPEDSDMVQIVTGNREWEDYEEVNASSELLKPFLDYYIWCMGPAKSDTLADELCLRFDIHEKEYGDRS